MVRASITHVTTDNNMTYLVVTAVDMTSLAAVTVTSPMSGASRGFLSDLSTFAYSSSTGDKSERSLSELQGSAEIGIEQNNWKYKMYFQLYLYKM